VQYRPTLVLAHPPPGIEGIDVTRSARVKWVAAAAAGLLGIIAIGVVAARARAARAPALHTQRDKASYAMGAAWARNLQRQAVEIDVALVARGLEDALSGKALLMGEEELRATMVALQGELTQRKARSAKTAAEAREQQGRAFMAENAKKEGVVSLPSGLQYKILKAGHGRRPTDADAVECRYRGSLVDGTEFDSSPHGKPATFDLAGVIPGWREALNLMPAGSRWLLFIPPELAYGARGAGSRIGPSTTLVFDLELLAIKPARSAAVKTAAATPAAGAREK
jgi:FKBP-type peptidyl-prolyl cis-trans isomerase